MAFATEGMLLPNFNHKHALHVGETSQVNASARMRFQLRQYSHYRASLATHGSEPPEIDSTHTSVSFFSD